MVGQLQSELVDVGQAAPRIWRLHLKFFLAQNGHLSLAILVIYFLDQPRFHPFWPKLLHSILTARLLFELGLLLPAQFLKQFWLLRWVKIARLQDLDSIFPNLDGVDGLVMELDGAGGRNCWGGGWTQFSLLQLYFQIEQVLLCFACGGLQVSDVCGHL